MHRRWTGCNIFLSTLHRVYTYKLQTFAIIDSRPVGDIFNGFPFRGKTNLKYRGNIANEHLYSTGNKRGFITVSLPTVNTSTRLLT